MTTTAQQLMTAEEFFDWVQRPEKAKKGKKEDNGHEKHEKTQ